MKRAFHVKDELILLGSTPICAAQRDHAQALCDLLEATRQMDVARSDAGAFSLAAGAQESAWRRLRELLAPDEED